MFALRPGKGRRSVPDLPRPDRGAGGGFVLPRLLRRPARQLSRLFSDDLEAPRFGASMLTAALFVATGLYGAWLGGQLPALAQAVTARTGFAVDDIRVVGNREISEIDVVQEVGLDGWTSLIGFDAAAARDRIAGLAWVESAAVQKIYPGTLEVRVEERKPFAIWQHGRELTIIEADGRVIAPFQASRHARLPLVIGMGAAERGPAFVAQVAKHPAIASRVVGYMLVAERRWDIKLENGITIKLPEGDAEAALAEIVALDAAQGLLSRDVSVIDLRLGDRIVVRLSEEAAAVRAATLKEALGKAYKRPGQEI